jgi:hypothetical protein
VRQEISISSDGQRPLLALSLVLVACAIVMLSARSAQANNDFQNGFEDQLGRIAANSVVAFGASVLSGGYYPVVAAPVYYAPAVYYAPPVVYAPAYYAPPRRVKVKHVVYAPGRPYYYGGCGHGRSSRRRSSRAWVCVPPASLPA